MAKITKFRSEFIFNVIMIILSIVMIFYCGELGFGTLKQPGSGLFPFFIGLFILITNVLLIIFKLKPLQSEPLFKNRYEMNNSLCMLMIFVFWIILMPLLGYILVTFIAVFSFSKTLRLEGWVKPLILSIGTTMMTYFLFDVWLYLDLPRGILG